MNFPVYLDHAATSPLLPEALEAMMPFLGEQFGNPSSLYSLGQYANDALSQAREQVDALLCCSPDEIYFTSGGTESIQIALFGAAFAARDHGKHIYGSRDRAYPPTKDTSLQKRSRMRTCAFHMRGSRVLCAAMVTTRSASRWIWTCRGA